MEPFMPPQAQAGFGAMAGEQTGGGIFGAFPPETREQAPEPQAQAGMGRSPDGMGAFMQGQGPPQQAGAYMHHPGGGDVHHQSTVAYWPQPIAGQLPFLEPQDTSGRATLQSAGFTALLVALTTGVGLAWGKGWGAAAGLTLGAGIANAYRAQKWLNDPDPSRRHEAVVSATIGIGELVLAGYSVWKAAQARKGS